MTTANAQADHHSPPPSIAQQAAKVKAEDAYTPVDGNAELNVNVLEDQVEHYYGSASASSPESARSRSRQAQATTPSR